MAQNVERPQSLLALTPPEVEPLEPQEKMSSLTPPPPPKKKNNIRETLRLTR